MTLKLATVPLATLGRSRLPGSVGAEVIRLAVVQAQRVAAEMTAERQVRRGGPSTPEQASTALLVQSCRVLCSVLLTWEHRAQPQNDVLLLTWAEHLLGPSCAKGLSTCWNIGQADACTANMHPANIQQLTRHKWGLERSGRPGLVQLSCCPGLLPAPTGSHSLC